MTASQSHLEADLFRQLAMIGLQPEQEYRFHPTRRWRFDFAFPGARLGIEVEGATWANGRHTRGSGYEADCRKYNAAALGGWRVLRFTSGMVESGEALTVIEGAVIGSASKPEALG